MTAVLLNRWRAWVCLAIFTVLAGCATPQRIGVDSTGSAFDRTGRFAINVVYFDGRRDAVQGGFAWHDAGANLQLDLSNPLGNTLARVQVEPGLATLIRNNGEREQAPHPDALVERVLGSPIPVGGLRSWLRGGTDRGAVSDLQKDADGRVAAFIQDGWRVQLSRYDALGPQLLQLNRNDSSRTVSVRLVVDGN
jgi:outer membrane lipoprotein LolB